MVSAGEWKKMTDEIQLQSPSAGPTLTVKEEDIGYRVPGVGVTGDVGSFVRNRTSAQL